MYALGPLLQRRSHLITNSHSNDDVINTHTINITRNDDVDN